MFRSRRRLVLAGVSCAAMGLAGCVGIQPGLHGGSVDAAESAEVQMAASERYPAGRSVAPAAAPDGSLGASDVENAVAASLPFLLREGSAWMDGRAWVQDGTGCVSCHQVPFAVWAHGGSHGGEHRADLPHESTAWATLGSDALAHTLADDNGRPGIFAPLLLAGLGDALSPPDRRDILSQLVERQRRDGRWRARGQFPAQRRPIDETDAVITMWNLLATQADTQDNDADLDFATSRDRAVAWLATQEAPVEERSTEWLLARVLLADSQGDPEFAARLQGEIWARQNQDGGWGFLARDASDALTTGQVLFALSGSGSAGSNTMAVALERGVDYLLASQNSDGSWTVPSRLFSNEPSDRNDYVYDVWGTSWATLGLSAAAR